MRKVVITISIVALAVAGGVGLHWHNRVAANSASTTQSTSQSSNDKKVQQDRQQQLKDWQAKVQAWNQQHPDQKQQAMPATMPNTGAGASWLVAVSAFAVAVTSYYVIMRQRLAHVAV